MDSREGREGFESNACNREANFYESILPLNKSSGIQTREKKIQQPDISEQYPGWVGVKRKSNVRHRIKAAVTKKQTSGNFMTALFALVRLEKIREFVIMKKSREWWGSKTVTQESETFFLH